MNPYELLDLLVNMLKQIEENEKQIKILKEQINELQQKTNNCNIEKI